MAVFARGIIVSLVNSKILIMSISIQLVLIYFRQFDLELG
jgi:threonine/homoserine/homoserine lactone efflux protein